MQTKSWNKCPTAEREKKSFLQGSNKEEISDDKCIDAM